VPSGKEQFKEKRRGRKKSQVAPLLEDLAYLK
jgi:hypothetical protein